MATMGGLNAILGLDTTALRGIATARTEMTSGAAQINRLLDGIDKGAGSAAKSFQAWGREALILLALMLSCIPLAAFGGTAWYLIDPTAGRCLLLDPGELR